MDEGDMQENLPTSETLQSPTIEMLTTVRFLPSMLNSHYLVLEYYMLLFLFHAILKIKKSVLVKEKKNLFKLLKELNI